MNIASLKDVRVPEERQRKDVSPAHIQDLKRSILSKGLLHPPVLSEAEDGLTLIAGGCRLRAMRELHEEGLAFSYNGSPVQPFTLPYSRVRDLDPILLEEAELEENLIRSQLTFQEEAAAKLKIHELRLAQNPAQTIAATAVEINSKRLPEKQLTYRSAQDDLHRSILVAKNLDNPKVKNAKNLRQAHRALLDDFEAKAHATLIQRGARIETPHRLIHGDCLEHLQTLKDVDVICTDPPYGINVDTMKLEAEGHYYDDTPENALAICKHIIAAGWHACKPKANLFLFCDIEHFIELREFAKAHLWSVKRTPLVWKKGDTGNAPWGRAGFARTYEIALYAVKGEKELYINGGPDSFIIDRPSRSARVHAAEKPVELFRYLLSKATLPGDVVLDPCCGSGVIFSAANKLKLSAIGIEKSEQYYNEALIRMSGGEEEEASTDDDLFDPTEPLEDEVDTGETYESQANEEG